MHRYYYNDLYPRHNQIKIKVNAKKHIIVYNKRNFRKICNIKVYLTNQEHKNKCDIGLTKRLNLANDYW